MTRTVLDIKPYGAKSKKIAEISTRFGKWNPEGCSYVGRVKYGPERVQLTGPVTIWLWNMFLKLWLPQRNILTTTIISIHSYVI